MTLVVAHSLQEVRDLIAGMTPEQVQHFAESIEDPDDLLLLEQAMSSFTPPVTPGPLPRYHDAPSAFARDLVRWPEGGGLTPYQASTLDEIVAHFREALRGPHTLGKTSLAALAIWWFALTRDAMGEDWKIPTTAYRWQHLVHYLWPEVHKWYRLLRWDVMDRPPVVLGKELLLRSLKLGTGEAFAASPDDAASIEGAHATQLLYVFDEAKTIPTDIWDAVEGAFAGAGPGTGQVAYALAISTPGEPNGRFYDICRRRPGTEDWHVRQVRKDEAIAAGRMSEQWAEQRARQWGVTSAVYLNRVEGEFASSDEDGVIPLAWVEAAQIRWAERFGDEHAFRTDEPLRLLGVDCSGSGQDRTVIARRYGREIIGPLERPLKAKDVEPGDEEMATAGRIVGILTANPKVRAVVDAGGLGSPIVGRVREQIERSRVIAFVAGAGTSRRDATDEFGFTNVRSAAWWNLREMLHPNSGMDLCLPPDDRLTGDLTAPHWKEMSGGRIQVEKKEDIHKRLGRSTDDGDAVVQAFWETGGAAKVTSAANVRIPKIEPPSLSGELRVRPRPR